MRIRYVSPLRLCKFNTRNNGGVVALDGHGEKRFLVIVGRVLSNIVMSILLETVLLSLPLHIHLFAIAQFSSLPSVGGLSGEKLSVVFQNGYLMIAWGVAFIALMLLLLLMNDDRICTFLLIVTMIFAIGGLAFLAGSFLCDWIALRLFDDLKELLGGYTRPLSELLVLSGATALLISAAFLSAFATISAVKGGRHEEMH